MKKRGKDSDIKSHKAKPPRWKAMFLQGHGDIDRVFVKMPDCPKSALKEGARNMAEAFPQSHAEVLKHNPSPEKRSKKQGNILQFPSKTSIPETTQPTGRVRMDHPPDRNIQLKIQREVEFHRKLTCLVAEEKMYLPATEADARVTIEIRTHYSGMAGHCKDNKVSDCADDFVGPINITHNPGIKPSGYGFAHKKPEIKTGLTPSGQPISNFLDGGKHAPINRKKLQVVTSAKDEIYTGAKWFKNNVPDEYQVDLLYEYEELQREHSQLLVDYHCENEEMHEQLFKKQDEIEALKIKVKELEDELLYNTSEQGLLRWEAEVTGHYFATERQVPQLKTVASEFVTYKKLYEDNPLRSFLRERGYSFDLEKPMYSFFTMQMDQRTKVSEDTKALKRIGLKHNRKCLMRKMKSELHGIRNIGVTTGNLNYLNVKEDKRVFYKWAHRDTLPRCTERINYIQWWQEMLTAVQLQQLELRASPEQCELRKLQASKYYKPAKAIVSTWYGFKDAMTKERQTPWAKAKADKLAKQQAKVEASRIKHERDAALERQLQREQLREAMRIAH